jgi:hypothetical protein
MNGPRLHQVVHTPVEDHSGGDEDGTTLSVPQASAGQGAVESFVAGAMRFARSAQQISSKPSVRPWLLGATAVIFVALVVVSFRALPEGRSVRPGLLAVLVLVATPSTLLLNAVQYRTMAAALNHRIGLRSAMRVSIVATFVNYLPIPAPGGIAVRTAALARRGSTIRSAVSINAITGLLWAGVAAAVAGLALLSEHDLAARGAIMAAGGTVTVGVSAVLVRRFGLHWRRVFGEMLVTQVALVLISGLRVWISLAVIGETASLGAALVISCSTVIAALVGIAPAGLGLREAIAGGLAAAVDVPVAAAVAASAVDRVASQVGLLLCAPFTGLHWRDLTRRRRTSGEMDAWTETATPARNPGIDDLAEVPDEP